jgi:2'-5' RNA ligase
MYDLVMANQGASEASAMGEQEKLRADDADGNCKQCRHPFNPHMVIAYDTSDFSKGGEIRSPWRDAVVSTV